MPIRGSRFSRFLDMLPFVFVQNPLSLHVKLIFSFSIHLLLYPISLEVRSTRSSHQIFSAPSFVTVLAPLSIFYPHILFLLATSLDSFFSSCSMLCKKELSKEEYIMYYDEYIFVEFFCFNVNLWLCRKILIWCIDNPHITRYFYNTILIFSI